LKFRLIHPEPEEENDRYDCQYFSEDIGPHLNMYYSACSNKNLDKMTEAESDNIVKDVKSFVE
jgi:hypothetical protein